MGTKIGWRDLLATRVDVGHDSGMDRAALEQLLRETEILLYREELTIARQRETIADLQQRGLDASSARMALRRLEIRQARHIADRNRLFQQLAERAHSTQR